MRYQYRIMRDDEGHTMVVGAEEIDLHGQSRELKEHWMRKIDGGLVRFTEPRETTDTRH
jgi:hypothetical protein